MASGIHLGACGLKAGGGKGPAARWATAIEGVAVAMAPIAVLLWNSPLAWRAAWPSVDRSPEALAQAFPFFAPKAKSCGGPSHLRGGQLLLGGPGALSEDAFS